MDTLIAALTLLLPPSISLIGCYKRGILDMQISPFFHYLAIAAKLFLLLTLELWLYEIIAEDILYYHARKVQILAVMQAYCYPIVHEFFQKHLHIMVEINETKHRNV